MDKGESTQEDIEKLKKMVPKSYQKYIESECLLIFSGGLCNVKAI